MVFIALVAKTSLSAAPVLTRSSVEILSESYAVQLPRAEVSTPCGLNLLINSEDCHLRQRCTLRGLLVVKDRILGLTAEHPFSRIKDNLLQRELSEVAEDMDESNARKAAQLIASLLCSMVMVTATGTINGLSQVCRFSNMPKLYQISSNGPACSGYKISRSFSSSMEWSLPHTAILSLPAPPNVASIEDGVNDFD